MEKDPIYLHITPPPNGYFEVPPWVVQGGDRQLTVTTGHSYACWTTQNPLDASVTLPASQCTLVTASALDGGDWKRNYDGVFTQHRIHALGEDRLIAFDHGENKNECFVSRVGCDVDATCGDCVNNTVNTSVSCSSCSSGMLECGDAAYYDDCWDAYNAFVTLSWQYFDVDANWGMQTHQQEGPIVWPSNGYTFNGKKSSTGVRQPHAIIAGSNIYVFYEDTSNGNVVDRGYGIKVARAPVASAGLPGNWQTYCSGQWVPSLPAGFDRTYMENFYGVQGGCASPVLPLGGKQTSFAVVETTQGGYLGVEENFDASTWKLRLWCSADLVHWTMVQELRSANGGFAAGDMHYPVFLSNDGWSSEIVDSEHDFYVLGTGGNAVGIPALHVHR